MPTTLLGVTASCAPISSHQPRVVTTTSICSSVKPQPCRMFLASAKAALCSGGVVAGVDKSRRSIFRAVATSHACATIKAMRAGDISVVAAVAQALLVDSSASKLICAPCSTGSVAACRLLGMTLFSANSLQSLPARSSACCSSSAHSSKRSGNSVAITPPPALVAYVFPLLVRCQGGQLG